MSLHTSAGKRIIRHRVQAHDDLCNLAVHYGTSIAAIRRLNRQIVFDYLDNCIGDTISIEVDHDWIDRAPADSQLTPAQLLEKYTSLQDDDTVPGTDGLTKAELQVKVFADAHQLLVRQFCVESARLQRLFGLHFTRAYRERDLQYEEDEADFYLAEAHNDVQHALIALRSDLEFEARNPQQLQQSAPGMHQRRPGPGASSDDQRSATKTALRQSRLNDALIFRSQNPTSDDSDAYGESSISNRTPAVQLQLAQERLARIRAANHIVIEPTQNRGPSLLSQCLPIGSSTRAAAAARDRTPAPAANSASQAQPSTRAPYDRMAHADVAYVSLRDVDSAPDSQSMSQQSSSVSKQR